jgi:hypothetical protein
MGWHAVPDSPWDNWVKKAHFQRKNVGVKLISLLQATRRTPWFSQETEKALPFGKINGLTQGPSTNCSRHHFEML